MKKVICIVMLFLCIKGQTQPINKKILITYYSSTNHTKTLAEEVAKGAQSILGIDVIIKPINETKINDLLEADAIIVGSPVHNANVSAQIVNFIDQWPFEGNKFKNKIGAAFVTAGGISAGEELAQVNILHSMLVFGMIIVGGDEWQSALGASAITEEGIFSAKKMDAIFLKKGFGLGKRVAEVTKLFKNN